MEDIAETLVSLSQPLWQTLESFAFIAEQTYVFKSTPIDAALVDVAGSIGMDLRLIKYMVTLVLAYPLCLVFRFLPLKFPIIRHIYVGFIGVYLLQWVFGNDWIHSFVATLLTYVICTIMPRKYTGSTTMFVVLGYMTGCHAYKMYTNYISGLAYWQFPLDFTGVQMVLTMKLTSFGYNIQDGGSKKTFTKTPDSELNAEGKAGKVAQSQERIRASREKYAIQDMPNVIEYLGYVYCFSTLMVGPTFEYSEYLQVVLEGKAKYNGRSSFEDTALVDSNKPAFVRNFSFFDSHFLIAAFHRMIIGIACMIAYLQLSGNGYQTYWAYDNDWIAERSHWARYAFTYICLISERFKFYFIWKMSEGANILAGYGVQYDDKGKVAGYRGIVDNCDVMGFEFSTTIQTLSRAWNKGTQAWLERYTYQRTNRSQVITYFVSAIWHGIYPGFFFFFLSVPLISDIEKLCQQKINPLIIPTFNTRAKTADAISASYPSGVLPLMYWVVCFFGKSFAMNFATQTFSMGYFQNSWTALASYQWIPQVGAALAYVVLSAMPVPKSKTA
jgi:hypothetical protein